MTIESPIGPLALGEDAQGITTIHRLREGEAPDTGEGSALLREAKRQLGAYFARKLKEFDLPLSLHGSPFEREVWAALRRIPYGEILSYGQLAALLGRPKGARAVGGACSRNPVLIVVPCHRVVAGSGKLTGFAAGLDAKRALLELEGWSIQDQTLYPGKTGWKAMRTE